MATDRSPAFRFYPKDWRDVKVRRMSLAAQGAYISLLGDMWIDSKDQCSLLDCDPFIAKSLGVFVEVWQQLREEIQHEHEPLFIEKNGRLYSKRLAYEVVQQRKFSKKQSKNAMKRWDAKAMPDVCQTDANTDAKSCSSSSLPLSFSSSDKRVQKKKEGTRSARGQNLAEDMPIPEDWTPTDEHAKVAKARGLELALEATHFKGRAQEQQWLSGNWNLKFRNWLIQEVKFRQARRLR